MVSVIIPSYNRASKIGIAAKSVLNQTYRDLELIIVDDCSTDNTRDVVLSLSDERVRYIQLEKNSGACVARNIGIDSARGEFIAFHDSDDIWHLNKLEKQLEVFKHDKTIDLCFCKMNRFKEDGKIRDCVPKHICEGIVDIKIDLYTVSTQTLIGKREVFVKEKFFPDMPRFQDYEILLRIQKRYSIYCLDEALVDYTLSSDSISKNPHALVKAIEILLIKYPFFTMDHKIACKSVSQILMYDLCYSSDDYEKKKDIIKLIFRINKSFKTYVKYLLYKIGLLKIYYDLRVPNTVNKS